MTARTALGFAGLLLICGSALHAQPAGKPTPHSPPAHEPHMQWRMPADPPPVTPEQEAELLEMLKQRQPRRHERLLQLREASPDKYQRLLPRAWQWYQHLESLPPAVREVHLQLQKVRLEIWRLSAKIAKTDQPEEKAQLKEKLANVLGKQFDLEQRLLEQRLAELEEQLSRLRADLARRTTERQDIIKRRSENMLQGRPRRKRPTTSPCDE